MCVNCTSKLLAKKAIVFDSEMHCYSSKAWCMWLNIDRYDRLEGAGWLVRLVNWHT